MTRGSEFCKYIVYLVTNLVTGKVYVGLSSRDISKRKIEHLRSSQGVPLFYFHSAIAKYGEDNFLWEVLQSNLTEKQASDAEVYYLSFFRSNEREFGYNMTSGGECGIPNEAVREKLRITSRNKRHTEETKQKIREPKLGGKASEETKEKMRIAQRNRPPVSDEVRRSISEGRKGIPHSEETKEKIRKIKLGFKVSEETKKKISLSHKGKKHSKEHSAKVGKASQKSVVCLETGVVYESQTKASLDSHINKNSISLVCLGKIQTAGGFHWKFFEGITND